MAAMTVSEIPATDSLLIAQLEAAGLPTGDLDRPDRRFFRFEDNGALIGFIGWEGSGSAVLLRSLVVVPSQRGHDAGARMTTWALGRLAELGCTDAYLLTTTVEALAQRLGFVRIERAAAPDCVRNSVQFAQLCPASAVLMHRPVPARK